MGVVQSTRKKFFENCNNKSEKRKVNFALSNTFGFGGHNASAVFKKYVSNFNN